MPRGGFNVKERSKDFKGSMIRLFQNMGKWKGLLILSIVLSLFGSLLATIAPNKLADVTDVITEGIKPNEEEIQTISREIICIIN